MTNLWRQGPLLENPYYRTAFRVARLARETVRSRAIVERLGQTRKLAAADPEAHAIRGQPVTAAEINAAEKILLDPPRRLLEELLEHARETPPLEKIQQLAAELAAAFEDAAPAEPPVTNFEFLRDWCLVLASRYLAEASVADASLGAPELELVPPFGRAEEEE